MIPYSRNSYNCAHYAVDRINHLTGSEIAFSNGDEWQHSFLLYLKEYFTRLKFPVDSCLVVMSQFDGTLHLGVYKNYLVEHNFNPQFGAGSVIKSDLGTINANYNRVRFYDYNHKTS